MKWSPSIQLSKPSYCAVTRLSFQAFLLCSDTSGFPSLLSVQWHVWVSKPSYCTVTRLSFWISSRYYIIFSEPYPRRYYIIFSEPYPRRYYIIFSEPYPLVASSFMERMAFGSIPRFWDSNQWMVDSTNYKSMLLNNWSIKLIGKCLPI